jgi:signal transduction histidine kinase
MGNSIVNQNTGKPAFSAARQDEDGGFSHVLRHELNNPLTGILGNAELLLAEVKRKNLELPPNAVRRVEIIVALAVRMRETVRRLGDEWSAREEEVMRELQSHPS